jgi:hypothetical protein
MKLTKTPVFLMSNPNQGRKSPNKSTFDGVFPAFLRIFAMHTTEPARAGRITGKKSVFSPGRT